MVCDASIAMRPDMCPQGLCLVPPLLFERNKIKSQTSGMHVNKTHLWKKLLPLMVLNAILC